MAVKLDEDNYTSVVDVPQNANLAQLTKVTQEAIGRNAVVFWNAPFFEAQIPIRTDTGYFVKRYRLLPTLVRTPDDEVWAADLRLGTVLMMWRDIAKLGEEMP